MINTNGSSVPFMFCFNEESQLIDMYYSKRQLQESFVVLQCTIPIKLVLSLLMSLANGDLSYF